MARSRNADRQGIRQDASRGGPAAELMAFTEVCRSIGGCGHDIVSITSRSGPLADPHRGGGVDDDRRFEQVADELIAMTFTFVESDEDIHTATNAATELAGPTGARCTLA